MNIWLAIIIGVAVFAIATYINGINTRGAKAAGVEASFAGLHVTKTELIIGSPKTGQRMPLKGLTATMGAFGDVSQRLTATRIATMGPFALAAPKTVDHRWVSMTVRGEGVQIHKRVSVKSNAAASYYAGKFVDTLNANAKAQEPPAAS